MALVILRQKEVTKITGLPRSSIYAEISKGKFPKQIKLSSSPKSRSSGWISDEVYKWLEDRIAERDNNEAA